MVNEVALYLCLVMVFLFSGAVLAPSISTILGWAMIGLVSILCAYNAIIIVIISFRYIKLAIKRTCNKSKVAYRRMKSTKLPIAKNKILPMPELSEISEDESSFAVG